ncbi:MAG: hypothetical protein HY996_09400, partial [Micrococcales bacterium]|nr:hypothetical protein [Micrococcales bacterium]
MRRTASGVRLLLVVPMLAALALTGCGRAAPPSSEVGCPPGFSGAVAQRAVVGGTPTARVQVVPPSWLGVPVSGPLRNACVLRVTYLFRPSAGAAYQAMTPGDAATVETIAAAMLRAGWVATTRAGRMVGPGGRTAQLTLSSS